MFGNSELRFPSNGLRGRETKQSDRVRGGSDEWRGTDTDPLVEEQRGKVKIPTRKPAYGAPATIAIRRFLQTKPLGKTSRLRHQAFPLARH